MNYKGAIANCNPPSMADGGDMKKANTMIRLTNPYRFEKQNKSGGHRLTRAFFMELSYVMRKRWETYHEQNGTWYDYSDDGSWCSADEYDDNFNNNNNNCWEEEE